MKHIIWIDYAKSIAIFLVVLLHTHCSETLAQVINSFIIPLFFMMSGYLFSYRRNPAYGPFIYKRFRQLVVPYLWIGALGYLAWLLVLRHYGSDAGSDQSWYEPLIGILGGFADLMTTDIPLWFLLSLFVVEAVSYPLNRKTGNPLLTGSAALALSFLLYVTVPQLQSRLPFLLGPAISGIFFYSVGQFLSRRRFDGQRLISPTVALVALPVFTAGIYFNRPVAYYVCDYGNYGLFLLSSFAGSYLVFCLSYLLGRLGESPAVKFISRMTLIVCGLHILMFSLIKGIALYCFRIQPEVLTANIPNGILFALASFILSFGCARIISRHFRFLIDR